MNVLKKISPDRTRPVAEKSAFNIALDRVSQYNNFWKLSGRTKQSSDSGSNVLIRKNSNVSRKNRENNLSRGNKTHLIFLDQHHNAKFNDTSIKKANFNLSGPVNLRQDAGSIPFDSTVRMPQQQVSMARDSNKSQQLVPDTNSTLAYTAACVSSNKNNANGSANNRWILGGINNPGKTKYSPHALYFKRHKKSKESPYCTSGSNESSNGSKSMNPSKPSFNNDYNLQNSSNSNNSRVGSNSSNPSQNAAGVVNLHERRVTASAEKHLEPIQRERIYKTEVQPQNVQIIEDYGGNKEIPTVEQKKVSIKKPPQKLQDSNVTASSPSRGSVLTNPQQPGGRFGSSLNNSNSENLPLKPGKAIQIFKNVLTDYERGEILNYREIYWVGEHAAPKKVNIRFINYETN